MNATPEPAVAAYVDAVDDQLSHLPPDERAEIVEDVKANLDDLAREIGSGLTMDTLVDRLGTPADYAAELRAAAGLAEPVPAPGRPGFTRRLLRFLAAAFAAGGTAFALLALVDTVVSLSGAPGMFAVPAAVCFVLAAVCVLPLLAGRDDPAAELRELPGAGAVAGAERWLRARPWGDAAIDYTTSLRPAWWFARALAIGLVAAYIGTAALGVVVFLAVLALSVWLGRKAAAGQVRRRTLSAVNAANVALAAGAVVVAASILNDSVPEHTEYPYAVDDVEVGAYTSVGEEAQNIFAYDLDGTFIEHVRLYDQAGNPLELPLYETCYGGALPGAMFVQPNPWGDNVFPRPEAEVDELGECQTRPAEPPFGERLPSVTGEPTPTPSPSPLPTGGS